MPDTSGPPRGRLRRLLLPALVLVALGGWLLPPLLFGPRIVAYAVARGELVQTVVASGKVRTPQRVEIGAQITGQVVAIPVDEGSRVAAGDVLIELDAAEARAAVEQARAALAQAEARLRQIREVGRAVAEQTLLQAQANRVQAARALERAQGLVARKFIGMAELDDARRAFDVAESQVRAARLTLDGQLPGGADVVLAEAGLAQARASLALAEARLGYTRIVAPAVGVLIARAVEPGDVVQPGRMLMALAPDGETRIEVQIDEKNLAAIALGQSALASADAFPDRTFAAELIYINPAVDASRGAVDVKLRVPEPPPFLRQDMTVSVDIQVAQRADALVLPLDAVREAPGGGAYVLVVRDGRAQRQAVSLGVRGGGRVEVRDGLSAGEYVVPAAAVDVVEGSRVRVRASGPVPAV